MSRYNNYGNGKNNRGVAAIIAIVLAAIVAFGAIFWDHIVIIWNDITRYVQRVDKEVVEDKNSSSDNKDNNDSSNSGNEQDKMVGENFVVKESNSSGVMLLSAAIPAEDYTKYGVTATAESAYTLRALINPYNTTDELVDWSIAWKNGNSTWATGKVATDYVTVTATDGATISTVSCLQGFGEQLIITARMRNYPDVYATATVDYVQRLTGVSMEIDTDGVSMDSVHSYNVLPTYGTGTIKGDFEYRNFNLYLTDGFKAAVLANMSSGADLITYLERPTVTFNSDQTFAFSNARASSNFIDVEALIGSGAGAIKTQTYFDNAFRETVGEYTDTQAIITFDYTYFYGDIVDESATYTFNVKFDQESLIIVPTEVTLSDSNLIF